MPTLGRLLVIGVLTLLPRGAGATVSITTCGTAVPEQEIGVLAADLACSANAPSVTLANRATLDLAGYTLTHDSYQPAVQCEGARCAVLSSVAGGTIVTLATAIIGNRVGVSDCAIDVTSTTTAGDVVNAFRITATNVQVSNATSAAFLGLKIRATNVDLVDCWVGFFALSQLRGDVVTVTGGAYGINAAKRARVSGLAIHGAGYYGVRARSVRLIDADVTGNGTFGPGGADLATERRPILVNTACGTSQVLTDPPGTVTWGVCQND